MLIKNELVAIDLTWIVVVHGGNLFDKCVKLRDYVVAELCFHLVLRNFYELGHNNDVYNLFDDHCSCPNVGGGGR